MKDVAALYRRLAAEACHELAWRMPGLGIRAEAALTRLAGRLAPEPATPSPKVGLWQLRPPEGSIVEWKAPTLPSIAEKDLDWDAFPQWR